MANKYRLGNQSAEYKLETAYLGWMIEDGSTWDDIFPVPFMYSETHGKEVTLVNPDKTEKVVIVIDHKIIRSAFPLSFYLEERAQDWYSFCIVSTKENPSEKIIIPLH
jgi:hypothetical protein